ncbi:hypothetical protein BDW02DRAFT_55836 [Decorospora gaudefroyi]|uniref:Uncharacterized protein n=1 Tax=Decorospora gaudefroyi TaxID=184978 RepID=A0A6A5K8X6_9PLEO|nr:hypothetical protein BDW02DRAFT_55836 [Decorospora gaudefroyi]
MHCTLDTTSFIFSFVAGFACCMLITLVRRGAPLNLFGPASSPRLSSSPRLRPRTQPSRTYLPHLAQTRFSTPSLDRNSLSHTAPSASPRPSFDHPSSRPHATTAMLKQAVQIHDATALTSPPSASYRQASIGNAFGRIGSAQAPATRPLGNGAKQNTAGARRPSGIIPQGTKRTSNGLAKSLSSQEDVVDYPLLNIADVDKENQLPAAFHTSSRSNSGSLASALFDEDDFDSDIDLDVEDPATKGTVAYPALPQITPAGSVDSGYASMPQMQTAFFKPEADSSQPVPWSSSPLEHFKTPQKQEPPKSKRRMLPWPKTQNAQTMQEQHRTEPEEEKSQSKKRRSAEADKSTSTPAPKETKPAYDWNTSYTTESAMKLQKNEFREKHKVQAKTNQATEEDIKEAKKKKNKNTIHRIFLSEEQQNVLNLVTEYKKN